MLVMWVLLACHDDPPAPVEDPTTEGVLYVTPAGMGQGTSWADALGSIHDALDLASDGDSVWVAAGTYLPDAKDRARSFVMRSGVGLYGGFAGDEGSLDERDWAAHPTILSGDIGVAATREDNSTHVVTGADDAVLDGFTIQDGYAVPTDPVSQDISAFIETDEPDAEILRILVGIDEVAGGGMFNLHAAPEVRNVVFRDNEAFKGGAVYNMVTRTYPKVGEPSPAATFDNVVFQDNAASTRGGAVSNDMYSSPQFTNTVFLRNTSDEKGGAVYNDMRCSPSFADVLFADNWSERGGALTDDGSSLSELAYVTFVDNRADDLGAAIYQGTYVPDPSTEGTSNANVAHLIHSVVVGNVTAQSPSPIANWHDGYVLQAESLVEMGEGDLDRQALVDADYLGQGAALGLGYGATEGSKLIEPTGSLVNPGYDYDLSSTKGAGLRRHVDGAGADGDGTSWESPLRSLTTALEVAQAGDEIWVAAGTYVPTEGADRTLAFVVRDDVSLYGGFCGTETSVDDRSPEGCETVLSGAIGGQSHDDDSHHVVVVGAGSIVDGLTIAHGNADGDWHHARGGGILAYYGASASLRGLRIEDNLGREGGGLCAYDESDVVLEDVTFQDNQAVIGGAALFRFGADGSVEGSVFSGNAALDRGGAVFVDYGANTALRSSSFVGNRTGANGGAVYVDDDESQFGSTEPVIEACMFVANEAAARGGAIAAYNPKTTVRITGSVFLDNQAALGGGAISADMGAEVIVSGSFFDANTGGEGGADTDTADGASIRVD